VNRFVLGDFRDYPPPATTTLIVADPVYDDLSMYTDLLAFKLPTILFMDPKTLCHLPEPDDIAFWIKPVSTKNTTKHYGRFVEAVAFYRTSMNTGLHWSNRTGIFTDHLLSNEEHPWKKPEILIERLIRNHYPGSGIIYDPCAGSRTVETVCKRLKIPSYSVELNPMYISSSRPTEAKKMVS
jgi:hypothetical protein